MKINLSAEGTDNVVHIDPDVMSVMITEAFLGVKFEADDDQSLSVALRDEGFEILYSYMIGGEEFESLVTLKAGVVRRLS